MAANKSKSLVLMAIDKDFDSPELINPANLEILVITIIDNKIGRAISGRLNQPEDFIFQGNIIFDIPKEFKLNTEFSKFFKLIPKNLRGEIKKILSKKTANK